MSSNSQLEAALGHCARRAGVSADELRQALDAHAGERIAVLFGVSAAEAAPVLDRLDRAWSFQGDAGAGCQLLTDELFDEIARALSELGDLAATAQGCGQRKPN